MTDDEEGTITSVRRKLRSAQLRCEELAKGERLMGFPESARVYQAMAEEFGGLIPWVSARDARRYMGDLVASGQLFR